MALPPVGPILFNYQNKPLHLENTYNGASCFLVGAGPSLNELNLTLLSQRGVLIASMNNVGAVKVRPNLWFAVDHPNSFCENIWNDPFIWKFVPEENIEKAFLIRDKDGRLQPSNKRIYNCPCVFQYRRNKDFKAESFLIEPTINWGNHSSNIDSYGGKGGRSVLFPALRILYYLGIRKVFLLGIDFNMQESQPYCFPQTKHAKGCKSNNDAYRIFSERLSALKPLFDEENYRIYNCNEYSNLKAFEFKTYEECLKFATRSCPSNPDVRGMYG